MIKLSQTKGCKKVKDWDINKGLSLQTDSMMPLQQWHEHGGTIDVEFDDGVCDHD